MSKGLERQTMSMELISILGKPIVVIDRGHKTVYLPELDALEEIFEDGEFDEAREHYSNFISEMERGFTIRGYLPNCLVGTNP